MSPSLSASEFHTASISSGLNTFAWRNFISGIPLTFSTISPAITKFVFEYCHLVPGSKSSGFFAHVSRMCCAVVASLIGGIR